MADGQDEGPVYYREIQKNGYLKRIPDESPASKLLPLGHKKPSLKPMWTLFCVHNGRTPYLEQYESEMAAATHRPAWRASLARARHVTAGLRPRRTHYAFLVDTDHGPVRMLAPHWDTMQEWVTALRSKLLELRILRAAENVYMPPPAAPVPRAAARDPTSPLPPVPPVPPDRVPGIELAPVTRPAQATQPDETETGLNQPQTNTAPSEPDTIVEPIPDQPQPVITEAVDISNWEAEDTPSTSHEVKNEPKKSVAKICGQNICLDDSILKRNVEATDSDEEFFAEIDRLHASIENIDLEDGLLDYRQRVVVNDDKREASNQQSDRPTNITVIQVSNKPPHTAIPVLGPETDVFNFEFKQNVPVTDTVTDFINIVNTENTNDGHSYGTVFSKESDYGHISLTTTVKLNGEDKVTENGIYERLCMASTSNNENYSPLPLRKLKSFDKVRKSSLPNLDTSNNSTYEYLYPNNNKNTTVTLNSEHHSLVEVNSNSAPMNSSDRNTSLTERVTNAKSTSSSDNTVISVNRVHNSETNSDNRINNSVVSARIEPSHMNLTSSVSVGIVDLNASAARSNVERSHSQNAYDRQRIDGGRQMDNVSPKRERNDKQQNGQAKPIWRRGLTELSLLSRLRRAPRRHPLEQPLQDGARNVAPAVAARARAELRADPARRRSSSLSNGQPAPAPPAPPAAPAGPALVPLRTRQALALRAELRRGAALPAALHVREHPLFVDYDQAVWIAWWGGGVGGARAGGRAGDRLAALRGERPRSAKHARELLKAAHAPVVDILFHRVPLAKIYVINKKDMESIGIKLDSECNIVSVRAEGAAARAGLPPPGQWAVTEINNRPLNLLKGGEEEMHRASAVGSEVSVLLQPSALVRRIRLALRAARPLLSLR